MSDELDFEGAANELELDPKEVYSHEGVEYMQISCVSVAAYEAIQAALRIAQSEEVCDEV